MLKFERLTAHRNDGRITRRDLLRRSAQIGVAGSALGVLLDWDPRQGSAAPRSSGRLVFAAREDIDILDPQITHLKATRELLGNVFDPLIRYRPGDTKPYPGLAESWQVSPDLTAFTFRLRQGVKFHDGTPLNAAAVKFSFDRIMSPAATSGVAHAFIGPFQSAEVVNDSTVRVRFSQPFAPFLSLAGLILFAPVSPTAVKRLGKEFGLQPVGTGPFKFKEWIQHSHMTFVKNPDYSWAPPTANHNGPAYLDEVEWRIVPEAGTRAGLAESGEATIVEEPSYADLQRLQQSQSLKIFKTIPRGSSWVVHINAALPPTDEAAIRQAILFGVNRDAIAKTVFRGFTEPAYSPIQPTMEGYDTSLKSMYPFDPSRSKKLLDEAGWLTGSDGIRAKNGKRLTLKWDSDIQGGFTEMAELIQAQLRGIGIGVPVTKIAESVWIQEYFKGQMNFGEITWWFPDASLLRTMFGSKSVWNGSHWKSLQMEALLDKTDATIDPAERLKLIVAMQQLVMKEAVMLPLAVNPTIHVLNKAVQGYDVTYLGFPLFYDVKLT